MSLLLGVLCSIIAILLIYDGVVAKTGGESMLQNIVDHKLFNGAAYLREFVNPAQPEIQKIAKTLKKDTPMETTKNIYNWFENGYSYATDSIVITNGKKVVFVGNNDTWNLPVQTLAEKRQGTMKIDCEDGTFAMVSLLRADGINAWANIGTVVIKGETYGHAWVTVVLNGKTYLLETTRGAPLDGFHSVPNIYHPEFTFNEKRVHATLGANINRKRPSPIPPEKIPELKEILDKQP